MVNAYDGVLVSCDAPTKQFILHLDDEQVRVQKKNSFVVQDLDDTHLMVNEDAVDFIRHKLEELNEKNTFSRDDLQPGGEKDKEKEKRGASREH